jgi:hypothetical protein
MTVQDALNQLTVVIIGGFSALALVGFAYVRTVINTRARKIKNEAEEAASERKLEYERKMREMEITHRERVANVEEKANSSAAIINTLENLTGAFFEQSKQLALIPPEMSATADALTMNTQTVGDLAEYVDKLAENVGGNTDVVKVARDASMRTFEMLELIKPNLDKALENISLIRDYIVAAEKYKTGETKKVEGDIAA